jgi:protein ImuA
MSHTGRQHILADLRKQIDRHGGSAKTRSKLAFEVSALDDHLPGAGLARGVLHEVVENGGAAEFAGASTLFVAGIAARLKGPVLWCLNRRDLFAPSLASVGLHPDRVVYAETFRESDILPVVEEGLHEKGLAAVVGEATRVSLIASRRLQLAAEESGVTALIIRRWWTVGEKDLTALPTAAVTRWRISPFTSHAPPAPGLGRARWQVELLRCRGGEPRSWVVEACDATGRLSLPSELADRPHQTQARRAAAR